MTHPRMRLRWLLCWLVGRHSNLASVTVTHEKGVVFRVWMCLDCGAKDWEMPP